MPILLVIGIHREELAFGKAVAEMLKDPQIDVLAIPEGLTGRHPLPNEVFHSEALHGELYRQLIPHMNGRRLLIDLHTGLNPAGTCADIYCSQPEKFAGINVDSAIDADSGVDAATAITHVAQTPRLVRLGGGGEGEPMLRGRTIIPKAVWQNPNCLYAGLEVYLTQSGQGSLAEQQYALQLITAMSHCMSA